MKMQTKATIEAIYPLSPMQQGMLFNTLYHADANTDFIQQRYILHGDLNAPLLRAAWSEVVARHAILRTQFRWEDAKQPLQIVWSTCELPWQEYDWSQCSPVEQEMRLLELLQQDFAQGFNLKKAPLFRLSLVRLSHEVHQLIWSYHHILLDGWSLDIIQRETTALYTSGLCQSLDTPAPYKSYITWQQRQDTARAEAYWRETLAGFQSATKFRVDRAPAYKTKSLSDCREAVLGLPSQLAEQIQRFKQRYHITPNTLIQAAWAYLLSCYSGDKDVVFGSVVAGRSGDVAGIDSMVGLFINTLPTRVYSDPQKKILPWLRELQQQQVDARQHEYCSLSDIIRCSAIPQTETLFESVVAFANYQEENNATQKMGDILVEFTSSSTGYSTYPLVLSASISETLLLSLIYDRERFAEDTATRMLGHMHTLLAQMVKNPMQPLATLTLLTDEEKQELLGDWNHTVPSYTETTCVLDMFKAQVAQQPDAVTLVFAPENQHLTCSALDAAAKQTASRLQQLGVGPEVLVGVCVERSLEMPIAVLGVLYAGGAFVPLDPTYPQERLTYMCEDARISVLITQKHLAARFPSQLHLVYIDECIATTGDADTGDVANSGDVAGFSGDAQTATPVQARLHPDNIAYVIYTSGSTGRSKGAMIPHRGLSNLMEAVAQIFGHQKGKRGLQFSSLSFDASIWDMVAPLAMGSTLLLTHKEELLPGAGLQDTLLRYGITTATLTPSVLAALPYTDLPDLQTLITAGEACPPEIATNWARARSFYNAYGPTESTVCATAKLCQPDGERPSIGTPLANLQVYILDARLHPLPIGVPGEIYLGGIGLARGYLGRPSLTAERFVPHPFSQEPGARLYKTGDLACWRADGEIEFLGRLDRQVKVRGFRIEPGEIEIALEKCEDILHSVVIVREDTAGDKRLVAYMVPAPGKPFDLEKVRGYLQDNLPAYMVPAALIAIDALPLTPNGKLDQQQLPSPDMGRPALTSAYQPPRDTFELLLVQIYEELLNVRPVGSGDDFFALGGHSLLAVRLMNEIQKRLHVAIPLSVIFQNGTISHLATLLREKNTTPPSPLVAIRSAGTLPPLFLVHPANGQVACYYKLAKQLPADQPLYGLQDPDLYSKDLAEKTIEEMASSYLQAIRAVQAEGPYYLGGYSFGGVVAFEMAQQLLAAKQEVALLTIIDGAPPASEGSCLQPRAELLATIVGEAIRDSSGKTIQDVHEELESLSFEQQLEYAMILLRTANVNLLVMEKEWLREQVELFAQRLRAIHRYRARVYPGRITLLRASERDALEDDPSEDGMLWQNFTRQPLDVRPVPGYHNTLLNEPYIHEFVAQLQSCLLPTDKVC